MAREEKLTLAQAMLEIGMQVCSYRNHALQTQKTLEETFRGLPGYIEYNYQGVFDDDAPSFLVMHSTLLLMFLGVSKSADQNTWRVIEKIMSDHDLESLLAHLSPDEKHQVVANIDSLKKYFCNAS